MKPVRQFYNDNAHIFIHGDEHFSDIFRLHFLSGGKRDLTEFSNAVHEQSDLVTKMLFNKIDAHLCILNHIVQQGGNDTLVIHTEIQKDLRNGDRVHDIRLAGAAFLILVRLFGDIICLFDFFGIILRILLYLFKKSGKAVVKIAKYSIFLSGI